MILCTGSCPFIMPSYSDIEYIIASSSVHDVLHQERMELNAKKCKEMIIDFRKNKTIIRETRIGNQPIRKSKTTRSSGKEIYNFYCRTDVLGAAQLYLR